MCTDLKNTFQNYPPNKNIILVVLSLLRGILETEAN